MNVAPAGAVIFVADLSGVVIFYSTLLGLTTTHADSVHAVLQSDQVELTIHAIPAEYRDTESATSPPIAREDSYLKLFFAVPSIDRARTAAAALGGEIYPESAEWVGRGFRACDGIDPEGNVFQVREMLAERIAVV